MTLADLVQAYRKLPRYKKVLVWLGVLVVCYILDAWLLGSVSFIFTDWPMVKKCMANPFYAAVQVPLHGSRGVWLFMNLFALFCFGCIFFGIWTRYPEIALAFRRKELCVVDDPSCGSSKWLTEDDARKVFKFGHGPGVWLGRINGEVVRYLDSRLNRNAVVFGPPGTGKTWTFGLPNVLQAFAAGESVIVTDPKAEILAWTVKLAQKLGYVVRCFNLVDMLYSDRWNAVAEVREDLDAYLLSQVIIENTEGPRHRPLGDPFWERSEHNLLTALILYTAYQMKPEQRNLPGLYDFLACGSFDELDSAFRSLPDDHPAKRPYNLFCMSEAKTRGNIIQGLGTRLKIMQDETVRAVTSASDIDLELPGRRKCAYYCILPDTGGTYRFLTSLFFSFLFIRLMRQADRFGGENPVRVNFVLDEFCNIGTMPDFVEKIATMRSRGLSCLMVVQSLPQMKSRYPLETWKEIVGCCALRLVWGAAELDTAEYISELLGDATVETLSYRRHSGKMAGAQIMKSLRPRRLLTPSEVTQLPKKEGIALLLGQNPVRLEKAPFSEHPLYRDVEKIHPRRYVPVVKREIEAPDVAVDFDTRRAVSSAPAASVQAWDDMVVR